MDDASSLLECIEVGATVLQAAKFLIGWLDRYGVFLSNRLFVCICDLFIQSFFIYSS